MNTRIVICSFALLFLFKSLQAVAQGEIVKLFEHKAKNVMASGSGTVIEILHKDSKQCLFVRLANNLVLQVLHDTSHARSIEMLQEGDVIEFHGIYEWSETGGVISHTYLDTADASSGWLKYRGEVFQ
jgi:hypothetical protein